MIKYFESEEDAIKQANEEARSILSNRAYINPDKFGSLMNEYRRRQRELDAEIALNINNQVENVKQVKEYITECDGNLDKVKEQYAELRNFWSDHIAFHKDMETFDKVFTFRRNIKIVLDQLNDFLNMSSQLKELEAFHDDPANFEYIQNQIIFLKDLRESMGEKAQGEHGNSSQLLQTMIQRFAVLDAFEDKFYGNVFKIIGDCINYAKKSPQVLVKALKLIESADKHLTEKNKPPEYFEKCKDAIIKSIESRFNEMKDKKAIDEVQKQINFTVSDLVDVYDYVIPCFPKKYDIWKIFQDNYKANVERILEPFLDNEEEIKKSFGLLIVLATWLDTYEELLTRAGVSNTETDYTALKAKIKHFMPSFLEHIEGLLKEWTSNIMKQERQRYTPENLTALEEQGEDLLTNMPQDLFTLINNQLAILGGQIKGELYIEVLRIWAAGLLEFQKRERLKLVEGIFEGDMLKVVVYINNYYKCIGFTNEMEALAKQYANKEYHDRIEHIMSEIPQAYNESINEMLRAAAKLSFVEIHREIVFFFFKSKWLQEPLMEQCISTLEDYFASFKKWFLSPLHYSRVIRLCFEILVEIYVERFIYGARKTYNTTLLKEYKPKQINMLLYKEKKKESGEKTKSETYSNKGSMIATMSKDQDKILATIQKNYANLVPKSSVEKITKNFTLIASLLTIQQFDFQDYLFPVYETFGENGKYVLESCLAIRDDCDSTFRKKMGAIYLQVVSKLAAES